MSQYQKNHLKTISGYESARDLYKTGLFLDANENFEQWVSIDWTQATNLNRYGDSSCDELRAKLAEKYLPGFSKDNIFIGAGSNEIIELLIRGFVEQNETILVIEPNYAIYETQAKITGVGCKKILYNPELDLVISDIKKNISSVKMLFLCSPDNPTGHIITSEEIANIRKFYSGIIVIDEAYIEFAGLENSLISFAHSPNIIITRSFSKAWGLAGIRIGYAVANDKTISVLQKIKNSYNVSAISQFIALQALDQLDKLAISINKSNFLKKELVHDLQKINVDVATTPANYILIRIKNASAIQQALAKKGVIVRDRSKLPLLADTLRITVGNEQENKQFITCLAQIIKETNS